ncbi:hypothetical protein KEM52_001854 [Ascosphaera acerosa]|nr:hypothetical protein KEM52_001854 [Ascosphaera acerosa]
MPEDRNSHGEVEASAAEVSPRRHLLASASASASQSQPRAEAGSITPITLPAPLNAVPPPSQETKASRVRFDIHDGGVDNDDLEAYGHAQRGARMSSDWLNEDDYLDSDDDHDHDDSGNRNGSGGTRGSHSRGHQSVPLLTDIEAPTVTIATSSTLLSENSVDEDAQHKSGLRAAFMNMANSIIGAGTIGQPYAIRQAGMLTGVVLLVMLTVVVDWTIRLIVVNSKLSGADSFQATVERCFGRPGLIAISLAQWAFAFGGMIAFCIIVGDTIPHVLTALFPKLEHIPILSLLTNRRACIVIFIMGVSYPLSLYRDISKLAKASAMALVSMLVIVVAVITQGFGVPPEARGDYKGYLIIHGGLTQAIGVISFAFVCHHNSLLIYGSLKKPTLNRFALVTHYSTGISMCLCLVMAMGGFLSFGSKTAGNVLNNFPPDNLIVNIARLCFGLNMLATLPLEAFVCRSVMETFYFPDEPFNMNRHLIFTTALVLASVALALVTCDLGSVFELIGSTSACALAYILPPMCFIKLSQKPWTAKVPAYLCIVFGSVVMVISVVKAVVDAFEG